ncbi:hypothetical protein B1R94_20115 [Mycolicibacterium litorale]|nr:hypothetical protein B1R94_20115 [Mycolicibacterium litorale]
MSPSRAPPSLRRAGRRSPVASAGGEGSTLGVTYHYHGQPGVAAQVTAATCSDLDGVKGFGFQNPTEVGVAPGDTWRAGSAADASCAYPNPDGSLHYIGTETGTVTLDGCGTGVVTIHFDGLATAPDAAGVRNGRATWQILPGQAAGELEGFSGSGMSEEAISPDNSSDGLATGTPRCPHPAS